MAKNQFLGPSHETAGRCTYFRMGTGGIVDAFTKFCETFIADAKFFCEYGKHLYDGFITVKLQILNARQIFAWDAVTIRHYVLSRAKHTDQVTRINSTYRTKTVLIQGQWNVQSEFKKSNFCRMFRLCMRFARCASFSISNATGDCRMKKMIFVEGQIDSSHMDDAVVDEHSIHNLITPVC